MKAENLLDLRGARNAEKEYPKPVGDHKQREKKEFKK
jgi:hypothetical protein